MADNTPSKKRRWYQNLKDSYTITKRSFPLLPLFLVLAFILVTAVFVVLGYFINSIILWSITGVVGGVLAAAVVLSMLLKKAMYRQLDGKPGAAMAVLQQLKRGWVIEEKPVSYTASQDVIWRLTGRCGVVLIAEGNESRLQRPISEETRTVNRIAPNVPVKIIQIGYGEGQVPLAKMLGALKKFKKHLTPTEVPQVANRLASLSKTGPGMPKGIDPTKVRPNHKALRGK